MPQKWYSSRLALSDYNKQDSIFLKSYYKLCTTADCFERLFKSVRNNPLCGTKCNGCFVTLVRTKPRIWESMPTLNQWFVFKETGRSWIHLRPKAPVRQFSSRKVPVHHPSYSPDLFPCEYFLFPELKIPIIRTRYKDNPEIEPLWLVWQSLCFLLKH